MHVNDKNTKYQILDHKYFLLLSVFFLFTCRLCTGQIDTIKSNKKPKSNFWKKLNTTADTLKEEYYDSNYLRYENYIYKSNIKSVQLFEQSWELSPPVIKLNSTQSLKLSFDDLDAVLKNYNYTIVHCSANWQPSEILINEYLTGFEENNIIDYRFSLNTSQKYVHYNAVFPNDNLKLTKSGNYLLKVYQDGNQENLIITYRFMVYDERITITPQPKQASIIEDRNFKQEIDFSIFYNGYQINNPYGDLKVFIMQNDRWDNAITDLKPLFVKDKELVYDFDDKNVFEGGNEFRNFDIKSLRYHSERVNGITFDSLKNHVFLLNDEKKSFKRYYNAADINGKYTIKIQEGNNSEIEADYAYVHFFLPFEAPLLDGNLYVFGLFSNWTCVSDNQMHYDYKRLGYQAKIYLKQGYYNYEYVFLKDGASAADETYIEGSHFETENNYVIYVYHRAIGTFYDQLIGVKRFNSVRPF